MTTSRQRKKQKSGHSASARSKRAVQKRLKRAPEIKGPAAIRENWDPKATVRQNYRNLGLVGDLSLRDSGGAEKTHSLSKVGREKGEKTKAISSSMATIERDEDGNVIGIQENTKERTQTVWGPALNSDDEDGEEEDEEEEDDDDDDEPVNEKAAEIISTLEEASKTIQPVQRFTSSREHDWLTQMVIKHGQDVQAMATDAKVNVWQKTAGEIRRAIKKAGGFEAVVKG